MVFLSLGRTASRLLLLSVGVGGLLLSTPGIAQSQVNRETVRSLNLSRPQMQQLRGLMQGYKSELEDILTSEQQQQLEDLQAAVQDGAAADARPDLLTELNLSTDQASELTALQADIAAELTDILSAEQLEQAQELGFPGL